MNDIKEKAEAAHGDFNPNSHMWKHLFELWLHLLPCLEHRDRSQCERDAYHHLPHVDFLKVLVARSILVLVIFFKEPLSLPRWKIH